MITLPPISTEITASLEPLKVSFAAAQTEAKKMAEGMAKAIDDAPIFGPAVKARFDSFEQSVRDGMAQTINRMREEAVQTNLDEEIKLRLYGPPQAEADVAQAEAAIGQIRARAQEEGGVLDSLKGSFGRGSAFFEMGHLLEGAGPILGIGLAAHLLDDATQHAAKMVDEFREGAVSGGEMADQIARSIPILGSIYESMASVAEIITGEQAEIKRITDEAAAMNAAIDLTREAWKQTADVAASINDLIAKMNEEIAQLHGAKANPFGAEFKKNVEDAQKIVADTAAKINETIEKQLGTQNIKNIDDLKAHIQQLQNQVNQGPEKHSSWMEGLPMGAGDIARYEDQKADKNSAAGVDAAKQQLSVLQQAMKGFDNEMATAPAGSVAAGAKASQLWAEQWQHAADQAAQAVAKQNADMRKKVTDELAAAKKEMDEAGMTENQKKLYEFAHGTSSTGAEIDQYKKTLDQIDAKNAAVEQAKKVDAAVDSFKKSLQSPQDKMNDAVKELEGYFKAGKITADQLAKGAKDAWNKANKETHGGIEHSEAKFADMIKPGGGEAMKLQFAAKLDSTNKDVVANKQLEEQKKMNDWLQQIYDEVNLNL